MWDKDKYIERVIEGKNRLKATYPVVEFKMGTEIFKSADGLNPEHECEVTWVFRARDNGKGSLRGIKSMLDPNSKRNKKLARKKKVLTLFEL